MANNVLRQGAIRPILPSAPSGLAGVLYFDSGLSKLRFHNGTSFAELADFAQLQSSTSGSSGATLIKGDNKAYANISGLTTYTIQDFFDRINVALASAGGTSFDDSTFEIFDNVDTSKKIKFQAANVPSLTTRTITMASADVDLGALTNSNISASAAIAYSKLALSNSIVNADISASAAIAYSKLNLASSIVNADINASAAIALTKLAALPSTSRALISDGSGVITESSVTSTELGYLSGVSSSIQTQLNAKLNLSGGTMTGFLTLSGDPTSASHAATKNYVDTQDALLIKKDGTVAFTGHQSMGTHRLTDVVDPVDPQDAATKSYVDAIATGLHINDHVEAATTAPLNVTPAGSGVGKTLTFNVNDTQTIDTHVLLLNDRILVKNQAASADNGIYVVTDAGSVGTPVVLTRATDFDGSPANEVRPGDYVFVAGGSANNNTSWVTSNEGNDPIVVDTDPIVFIQFAGAGSYTAGDGIKLTGSVFSITTDNSLTASSSDPRLIVKKDPAGALATSASGLAVNVGNGIQISSNAVAAKLADASLTATGSGLAVQLDPAFALSLGVSGLKVNVDNVSLDISANALQVKAGGISNSHINNSAAIAYSKLALSGSIVNGDINASAAIAYSKLALSNSIVNADISASAAIAYSKLALSNSIVDADISGSAAIAYSKLALSASIVNADIAPAAAIAYSKLNLSGSIVNADISASAAIAMSKLAAMTANRVLVSDASGFVSASSVTSTTLGYLDATSSIQTQLNSKLATVSQDTSPQLGGDLDLNNKAFKGIIRQGASVANSLETEYFHNVSLTASTTAVLSSLTFDTRDYKSMHIVYSAKNGNARRTGTIMIAADNAASVASSNVQVFHDELDTADLGLTWEVAMNGNNCEVSYTTGAGSYAVWMEVKRFKA